MSSWRPGLLTRGAIRTIQFEFNEMNIISHATFKDFWDILRGYHFFRLLPGGRLMPIVVYRPLLCEIMHTRISWLNEYEISLCKKIEQCLKDVQ